MTTKEKIENWIRETLDTDAPFTVEHPTSLSNGDYSTNIALTTKREPREVVGLLQNNKLEILEKIEVAGPGFINFFLTKEFFEERVREIAAKRDSYGENDRFATKRIMIEFTDLNLFKEVHIGHLMSNTIGESISRLIEFSGAEMLKANYLSDVGLNVAKALWGKMQKPDLSWGKAYAYGTKNYEENKEEIDTLNKKIYEKDDEEVSAFYEKGKKEILQYFETVYAQLGMEPRSAGSEDGVYFDHYFYESESAPRGKETVEKGLHNGVFEGSDGAIVFRGEKHDPKLHTRVFVTSTGLPTYEAKELGLLQLKEHAIKVNGWDALDSSIVITASEQDAYFKVVLRAAEELGGDTSKLAAVTKHLSHGMLRLPSGKMSSRTGDVITAESLIEQTEEKIMEKIKDPASLEASRGKQGFTDEQKNVIAEIVALGAIKFSILRQAIGGDIIFDFDKSISFEGDSGPYLQYTAVRANSVLEKAVDSGIQALYEMPPGWQVTDLEKYLHRFPGVVKRAAREYAPHYIVTYLLELAGLFNNFYAREKIVDENDTASPYKLGLTEATSIVLRNGLRLLGIKVPAKM